MFSAISIPSPFRKTVEVFKLVRKIRNGSDLFIPAFKSGIIFDFSTETWPVSILYDDIVVRIGNFEVRVALNPSGTEGGIVIVKKENKEPLYKLPIKKLEKYQRAIQGLSFQAPFNSNVA